MPVPPAVVAPPFLFSQTHLRSAVHYWLLFITLCLSFGASSMEPVLPAADRGNAAPGYLARIQLNTPEELLQALQRAEMLFLQDRLLTQLPPAAIVVHGPEVEVFFRDGYRKHKELADLAARLSAFGVVDVFVCETRMGVLGRDRSELYPFVGTVPFGPAEVDRLISEERYLYF